jgi:hypothetical protein
MPPQQLRQTAATAHPEPTISYQRATMPVNIKQITDAWAQRKSASLVINNTSVTIVSKSYKSLVPVQCLSFLLALTIKCMQIRIVGRVFKKKIDDQHGNFAIEDCTGTINASIWFTTGRHEIDCVT